MDLKRVLFWYHEFQNADVVQLKTRYFLKAQLILPSEQLNQFFVTSSLYYLKTLPSEMAQENQQFFERNPSSEHKHLSNHWGGQHKEPFHSQQVKF